jgi:hypothetical protein
MDPRLLERPQKGKGLKEQIKVILRSVRVME